MGSSSSVSSQEHLPQESFLDQEKANDIAKNEVKILNELELYKREKENEIKSLKKEITKLESDGQRLRGEMKMMEKIMIKLKNERENETTSTLNISENIQIEEDKQINFEVNKTASVDSDSKFHFDNIRKLSNIKYSLPELLRNKTSNTKHSRTPPFSYVDLMNTLDVTLVESLCNGCYLDDLEEDSLNASILINSQSPGVRWIPEKYLKQLTKYVLSNSISTPIVIEGTPGCGKSCLISTWIATLPKEYFVLYHEVASKKAASANPDLMFRRFLMKVFLSVSSNPLELRTQFLDWLIKCSYKLAEKVILVLDGADKFQNIDLFSWLLEPIPPNLRVIVSVNTHNSPTVWKSWPSIHVEPLTRSAIHSLLSPNTALQENELNKFINHLIINVQTSSPLYVKVLHGALNKWCNESNKMKLYKKFYNCKSLVELYAKILKKIIESSEIVSSFLQFLWISPNGISQETILNVMKTQSSEINIFSDLTSLYIININLVNQMITLANQYVISAISKLPTNIWSPLNESLTLLITYYKYSNKNGEILSNEACNELPRLFIQINNLEAAKNCLSNVQVFFYFYASGKTAILLQYWSLLNISLIKMADIYLKSKSTANIMQALEIFFCDLNLYDKSFIALQRCLEIRETSLDPDHLLIAHSFYQLAGKIVCLQLNSEFSQSGFSPLVLFHQWKKFTSSETSYKKALKIFEKNSEANSIFIAHINETLINIYKIQNR